MPASLVEPGRLDRLRDDKWARDVNRITPAARFILPHGSAPPARPSRALRAAPCGTRHTSRTVLAVVDRRHAAREACCTVARKLPTDPTTDVVVPGTGAARTTRARPRQHRGMRILAGAGSLLAAGAVVLGAALTPTGSGPASPTVPVPVASQVAPAAPAEPVAWSTAASSPAAVGAAAHAPRRSSVIRREGTYRWPTEGEREVLRPFDGPEAPWAAGHRGADLAVDDGEPVLAAAAGTVAFAGWVVDRGVVSVQHPDGIRTTYEPVSAVVLAGQRVAAGDLLGHLAAGGHCADACLHFGARRSAKQYLDPMLLIGSTVVIRLLPEG